MHAISTFHRAVCAWFNCAFPAPTPAQVQAWPAIAAGRDVLLAAPTGSGKTLAAFLAAIDSLVRDGLKGELPDQTQVVYVSPLKALSNDIRRNLELPLAGIAEELRGRGLRDVAIRAWVRTGDTPASERQRVYRRTPHIVVTFRGDASYYTQTDVAKVKPEDRAEYAKVVDAIKQLHKQQGVESMEQCSLPLPSRKIDRADIMPEVKVVPNGWIALVAYQQKGYAYISP